MNQYQARSPIADIYYLAFPADSYGRKGVVCVAFLLEGAQTILATRDAYRQFASGWGNSVEFDGIGWYWLSVVVLTVPNECLCQLFYAFRIYILSRTYWAPGIIVFVS